MKIQYLLFASLTICLLSFFSCKQASSNKGVKGVDITGEWESVYLKVRLHSTNNTEDEMVVESHKEEFPARLGIITNFGTYAKDGTFEDKYVMAAGDTVTSAGKWSSFGDTVVVKQTSPDLRIHKYKCILKGDTGVFTGMVDFDSDGKMDDEFYGISVLR